MKSLFLSLALLLSFTGQAKKAEATKELKVDTAKSTLIWKGEKPAGQHFGTIEIKDGTVIQKNGKIQKVNVTVNMKSIKNTDVTDKDWKKKLEDHLKNEDFFNVEKFDEASLSLTSAKDLGNGRVELKGKLKIKDVENDITTVAKRDGQVFSGQLEFDRTKYGIKFKSKNFFKLAADKVIYDTVSLDYKIVLK